MQGLLSIPTLFNDVQYSDHTHGQGRYQKKVDRYSGLCDACERLKYRREKQVLVAAWAHEYLEMSEFVVVDSDSV